MAKTKTKTKTVYRKPKTKKKGRRKKKTIMAKVGKIALPAGATLATLAPYLKRSKETGVSVVDLIQDDIKNWNSKDAIARLKSAFPQIAILTAGGFVVKELKLAGSWSKLMGDLLLGLGLGTTVKAVLDPPGASPELISQAQIARPARGRPPADSTKMRNPYGGN